MAEPLRLGGMALGNGLLVHGPTTWAAAVRRRDGTIGVASGRKPRLRGGVDRRAGRAGRGAAGRGDRGHPARQARAPGGAAALRGPARRAAAVVASAGGAAVRRRSAGPGAEAAVAALSVLPSLVALHGGEVAAYHGVEHKAIAAYEQGDGDARDATKEHDRCGSHLMAPLLAVNLAGATLLRRAVVRPRRAAQLGVRSPRPGPPSRSSPGPSATRDTRVARALRRPGHELQRAVGTREPSEAQLDVGRAALDEILRAERAARVPARCCRCWAQ